MTGPEISPDPAGGGAGAAEVVLLTDVFPGKPGLFPGLLPGGVGADRFILTLGSPPPHIVDFNAAEGDRFLLLQPSGAVANGTGAILALNQGTHALTWDPDGDAGPQAPVQLADVFGATDHLTAANLAAGFQPSALRVVAGDGGRTDTVFDWSGTQAFDHTVAVSNSQLQVIEYDVFMDDGATSARFFDPQGSASFDMRYAEYDAQGRLSTYAVFGDDHSETLYVFDTLNTQPFSRTVETWASNGQRASFTIVFDNGSSTVQTFDPLNNQPYSAIVQDFDPNGRLIGETRYGDAGEVFI